MSYNSSQNEDVTRTRINGVLGPKRRKKFTIKTDNRLKGAYAETDLDRGTIKINRKRHRTKPLHKRRYPEIADTIYHESLHVQHPKMTEREVRKRTHRAMKRMSKKKKAALYSTQHIYQRTYDHR